MKHLIIYAHSNPKSFTKAIVDEVESISKNNGDEVQIIDLYGDNFNPVLKFRDIGHTAKEAAKDVKKYRELISWAQHLTIVYPMWWGQMPAILKGFIDRVFVKGFAFTDTEKGLERLLKGKTAQLYINTRYPSDYYREIGMHDAQKLINDDGLFGFCGMDTKITFFGNVNLGTNELRKGYLDSLSISYSEKR